jgi:formamidopyrimidine-DNA glycosylase
MPELPDIEAYLAALRPKTLGRRLESVRIASPFLLRTVQPSLDEFEGRTVIGLSRLGKRVVVEVEGARFLVVHLMIAGRLQWSDPAPPGVTAKDRYGKAALARFRFPTGTLILTEAGTKRRASLHLVSGRDELARLDPGGGEPLTMPADEFAERLRRENRTLKRTLTDPRLFAGIGNAFSDEILHRARLSPILLTGRITDAESARLHAATISLLGEWTERLSAAAIERWPEKVTAFRPEFAVHGRFDKPCPECRVPVQRIVRAENEINYCPCCQTGGRVLADRSLSRLLKEDWPTTLEELEDFRNPPGPG